MPGTTRATLPVTNLSVPQTMPKATIIKTALTIPLHCVVGLIVTVLSTFVGERSAFVVYVDIMGCDNGCSVVASGWPLIFVTDYLGMSVVNTADILEVWFAADRISWRPFLANVGMWAVASFIGTLFARRLSRRVRLRSVANS